MKSMYSEEQNRRALEILAKINSNKSIKKITKEEMIRKIIEQGLEKIKRIDFNNPNITNDVAFINFINNKYVLIITNEKGIIITRVEFENIEEAYWELVDRLMTLKSFDPSEQKKTR